MKKKITKEYSNGELTVVWKPHLCMHSGKCVAALPDVYNVSAKPWIKPENATTQQLIEQIQTCPSGALSYYLNDHGPARETEIEKDAETSVEVLKNGPLMVHGTLSITKPSGEKEIRSKSTAFCRCGNSGNKPYCDGTHKKINFQG